MIINEFGREGIDGTLLAGLGAEMAEITGGSVFCACRIDQFEKALNTFVRRETETVLVEASGLSDPTGVRRLFSETDRFPYITYKGAICLVDAVRFPKVYQTSRTCVRQLAASDLVLINKTDLASEAEMEAVREIVVNQRPDIPVMETIRGQVSREMLAILEETALPQNGKMTLSADLTVRKIMVTLKGDIPVNSLERMIQIFLEESFRVKGFVGTREGVVLVDGVGTALSIKSYNEPVPRGKIGHLVILSGGKMPIVKRVKEACAWYSEYVEALEIGD